MDFIRVNTKDVIGFDRNGNRLVLGYEKNGGS
jgi:hypothetical protein